MAENTKIEWADHTFNPWYGCQKVGPGCDNCYAEGWAKRSGLVEWGPNTTRRRSGTAYWKKPLVWNAEAARLGVRYRVFCASLADVFDNAADPQWRAELFDLIHATPHLDWLLLTKRIGNVQQMLNEFMADRPWQNIWIGITVCNQAEADRDIPRLLDVPATLRFISVEPLLGAINIQHWLQPKMLGTNRLNGKAYINSHPTNKLDWVICGGETGSHARPSHPHWAYGIRDQCMTNGVPFFFKGYGDWAPRSDCYHTLTNGQAAADIDPGAKKWPCIRLTSEGTDGRDLKNACGDGDDVYVQRVGKVLAGRMLDGVLHDDSPLF